MRLRGIWEVFLMFWFSSEDDFKDFINQKPWSNEYAIDIGEKQK